MSKCRVDMSIEILLGSLGPFLTAYFSLFFFHIWMKQPENIHTLGFAISFAICTLGVLTTELLLSSITTTGVLLACLFQTLGMVCFNWSLSKRAGISPPTLPVIWVGAFFMLASVTASFISDDIIYRLAILRAMVGVQLTIGIYALWKRSVDFNRHKLHCQVMSLGAILCFTVPIGIYSFEGLISEETYRQSLQWIAAMILVPLMVTCLSTTTLLALGDDLLLKLKDAMQMDYLSGVRNRLAFEEEVARIFSHRRSHATPWSVILFDLDHFKSVNDRLGHQCGDEVIKKVGDVLRDSVVEPHLCGRVGGEEFCVVLCNANEQSARLFANNLKSQISQIEISGKPEEKISASFGVCTGQYEDSYNLLYRYADQALYKAKELGRDRVCHHSENPADQRVENA